ncbi:MAG: hypothetical protein J4432_01545 [DPANN group archaeon]|nr:hypothetical protein [DPANN group archaeon]
MKLMLLHSSGNKVLYDLDKEQIHTKYGILLKSEVNKPYGSILKAPNGGEFVVLEPSILDLVEGMKMSSKPIFPYDSGIMASLLNIKPGKRVLESGTGSGGFTTYLAELGAVVVTYEKNPDFFKTAQLNLRQYKNVKLLNDDVYNAQESGFDSIFLDLQYPGKAIEALHLKLNPGGFLGVFTPILDDVKPVWETLAELGFSEIRALQFDVKELQVKKYLRVKGPLGFPGFFIWARKIKK